MVCQQHQQDIQSARHANAMANGMANKMCAVCQQLGSCSHLLSYSRGINTMRPPLIPPCETPQSDTYC